MIPVYFCSLGNSLLDIGVGIFQIVYNIYWPLVFCLKNNVQHLENQIENYNKLRNQGIADHNILYKQIYGLSRHLRRQNILSFIALLIYCLVPIIFEMSVILMNEGKAKEFIYTYIPKKYEEY